VSDAFWGMKGIAFIKILSFNQTTSKGDDGESGSSGEATSAPSSWTYGMNRAGYLNEASRSATISCERLA